MPIALAVCLVLTASAAAQDYRVDAAVTAAEFQITFPSMTGAYFEVWTTEELSAPWSLVRGMTLGQDGTQTWTDASAVGSFTQMYYRLLLVPRSEPHDTDSDGIHDVYELEHPAALDPLDGSDALLDADGDTFPSFYEFNRGSDPASAASFPASPLFVDAAAAAGGTGSVEHPFNTIQAALDAATNYDVVRLADGVYTGEGNRALSYLGKTVMVVATGGAAACFIDGGGEDRAFRFVGGEGGAAILQGVTVRNGRSDLGGGIYCSNASPSIRDCVLEDNYATVRGGGLYCEDAAPGLSGCILRGNGSASNGGGVACVRSACVLRNSVLRGNVAGPGGGGGLWESASTSVVENCVVAGNRSNGKGDGVYGTDASATRLANSILWGNSGDQISEAGSSIQATYCCVESGFAGTGNTSDDPVFEAALDGDYHLLAGSSCIDQGDPAAAYNDADASRNDIGAFGGPQGSGSLGNHHPVAFSQSVTTGVGVAKAITLGASDGDSDPLTYTVVTQPVHGVLSGTAPSLTYTPTSGYAGADGFTFRANDGEDDSRVATVLISVDRAPLWVIGTRDGSDAEFDQSGYDFDFYPESETVSEFPKELSTNAYPHVYLRFGLSEVQADAGLEIALTPAWNDGSGVVYVAAEVWTGAEWQEADRTPCSMSDGGYLYVHPAFTKVGWNEMRLTACRATAGTRAVTWDQIVIKPQSQEVTWDFGTNDASSADLQQSDFTLIVDADTAVDTNFPKELNTTWYSYQYINFTLDAAEAQRPHLLNLDVAWNDGSGTVEVVLQRWDGGWVGVGTAEVSTVSPGVIEVPADTLTSGNETNTWRLCAASGNSNTTVVCWDRVALLARTRPPDAVLDLLGEVMDTSINFFLSSNAVHHSGLPLTALKVTDRVRFGYSNPTEWGYAIQSWIAGAEAGKLALTTAVALVDNSLMTMLTLQADPEQFKYGLFYPYYTVVTGDQVDVDFPFHDAYHELPSGDCALLWGSLNVAQGWLLQKGCPVTAAKAGKIKDAMDFHACYMQTNGGEYISMLINADTGALSLYTWMIWADEGGVVNIMSYFSGSMSADEFMGILDNQWRSARTWNGITTAESAWFSAAFTWPQRTMMGVSMLDDLNGRQFGLHSFIPAARGHLGYARYAGVDFVGFSDAMTQQSEGVPMVGRYVPPNITNKVESAPPAHIQPHGAFVWMGALDALEDSLLKAYFESILLMKNDAQAVWHPGYSQDPFGFEVCASPTMNNASYAGPDDGRFIFESLSEGYTILPVYEGLSRVRGGLGFADMARHVPGFTQTVQDALAYAYEGTPIGP